MARSRGWTRGAFCASAWCEEEEHKTSVQEVQVEGWEREWHLPWAGELGLLPLHLRNGGLQVASGCTCWNPEQERVVSTAERSVQCIWDTEELKRGWVGLSWVGVLARTPCLWLLSPRLQPRSWGNIFFSLGFFFSWN